MGFQRCAACAYQPLTQQTSVRPPPWLPGTTNAAFHMCRNCGGLTVQTANAQGLGQLWLLEPGAVALVRLDVGPSQVIRYIASDDYFANRGVTEPLFRGWVRSTRDVSMCINDLLIRANREEDPRRLAAIVHQALIVLQELSDRKRRHADVECRIGSISGLVQVCQGTFPRHQSSPDQIAEMRLAALDSLELLGQPWMLETISDDDAHLVDATIDHLRLVDRSREEIAQARLRMHSDGPLRIREETGFLKGLFERRDAHLPFAYADLLWSVLKELYARLSGPPSTTVPKAYDAVQALLEETLIALGAEPISWRADGRAFQLVRTNEVMVLRRRAPQVEVYTGLRANEPYRLLDRWDEIHALARQR